MHERPSASMSLMACGMVSGYSPPCSNVSKAQAGAVHMRVLRAFVWRHLRKFMVELHQFSFVCRARSLARTLSYRPRLYRFCA
jgi:hypothetical protein